MKNPWIKLKDRLGALGHFRLHRMFGDGNVRPWDWETGVERLPPEAKEASGFAFGLTSLPKKRAGEIFGEDVSAALVKSGLAKEKNKILSMKPHALIGYLGRPTFIHMSSNPHTNFSEDTKCLSSIPDSSPRRGSALSLFSNSGIEALEWGSQSSWPVYFYQSFAVPGIVEANWGLNGRGDTLFFLKKRADLEALRFTQIWARVPCLMIPAPFRKRSDPTTSDDGLAVVEQVWSLAGNCLADEGRLDFTLSIFGHDTPDEGWRKICKSAESAGLSLNTVCASRQGLEPGSPYFNNLVGYLQDRSGQEADKIVQGLVDQFCDRRMSHVYFLRGTAIRSRKGTSGHQLVDYSDRFYGNWLV